MDYWQKQTAQEPLFEGILWARPETRHGAGKLLVVGGNAHGFAAAGEAFAVAEGTGAGVVKVVLPDALKRTVGVLGPYDYAPSTPSGSFGREALNELLTGAHWADLVLVAGDLGRNSETAVLLESFIQSYTGPLVLTKDAIDYCYATAELIMNRPQTTLVLSLAQLQKLGTALHHKTPFLLGMGTLLLVQALHDFSQQYGATIITKESGNLIVAHQGKVSTTRLQQEQEIWRVTTAARAAVLWMQNPNQPYEAMTSAMIV